MNWKKFWLNAATEAGLTVERTVQNAHIKMYVRNAHDVTGIMVCPTSPSDHRGVKNKRHDFRRFASQRGGVQ